MVQTDVDGNAEAISSLNVNVDDLDAGLQAKVARNAWQADAQEHHQGPADCPAAGEGVELPGAATSVPETRGIRTGNLVDLSQAGQHCR